MTIQLINVNSLKPGDCFIAVNFSFYIVVGVDVPDTSDVSESSIIDFEKDRSGKRVLWLCFRSDGRCLIISSQYYYDEKIYFFKDKIF